MKTLPLPRRFLNSALVLSLVLPFVASAQQYFTYTQEGDVNVGFRKTGAYTELDEMVVYAGNISNFMAQALGTTVTVSNVNYMDLTNMCPDGLGNLQWSAFSAFQISITNYWNNYSNTAAVVWPHYTCWYTVARTNVSIQTTPQNRLPSSTEDNLESEILGVSLGANGISQQLVESQGATNAFNNSVVVVEPVSLNPAYNLTTFIGDKTTPAFGDFGGSAITFSVENTTPNSFTSPSVSDFYVSVPFSTSKLSTDVDPLTGTTNGTADYLGYFTLNPNGILTFTRAAAVAVPSVSSVTASATNGFGPLTVAFSDSTSGSATNWIWNFGNGTMITNTTAGNVTNTYAAAGSYTVTLTVEGPGGSSTYTVSNFIVTSPKPKINFALQSGKLMFSGTNCPAGVQYRILTSTNVATALSNWKPIYTNTFGSNGNFAYTNSIGSGKSFFRLVSP